MWGGGMENEHQIAVYDYVQLNTTLHASLQYAAVSC